MDNRLQSGRVLIERWARQFIKEGESIDIAWRHAVQRVFEGEHITEGEANYFDVRCSIDEHNKGEQL